MGYVQRDSWNRSVARVLRSAVCFKAVLIAAFEKAGYRIPDRKVSLIANVFEKLAPQHQLPLVSPAIYGDPNKRSYTNHG